MVADKIPFPSVSDSPTDDECIWAMVCHLSVLFGVVIVPLGILLLHGRRSDFIAFHAKQAALYQFILIVLFVITLGTFGLLIPIFVLTGVITALRARSGQRVMYPLFHRLLGVES